MIDAVGRPETYQQAFYARDLAGTVVLVGVPTPTMRLDLPLLDVFGRGGALKSSWYGDCLPSRDFPMLVDLYLQGRLPLERFVTETIGLDDVEEAFEQDAPRRGAALGGGAVTGTPPVERVVTSGIFSLDGQDFDVDNNVWLVGDDAEVRGRRRRARRRPPILAAVGGRAAARRSSARTATTTTSTPRPSSPTPTGAPVFLHPDDRMLWDVVHPAHAAAAAGRRRPGRRWPGTDLHVLHTPGHSPGCGLPVRAGPGRRCCPGDTLFHGGPGATGRSYSGFPTILDSIRTRLLTLPAADPGAHRAR